MPQTLPPPRRRTRTLALAAAVPFLLALGILTLRPTPVEETVPALMEGFAGISFAQWEVIANVAVFVPVGILAFLLLPPRLRPMSFLVGPALSTAIELFQAAFLPARTATVADVIANSAGATLGAGLALLCTVLAAPRPILERP